MYLHLSISYSVHGGGGLGLEGVSVHWVSVQMGWGSLWQQQQQQKQQQKQQQQFTQVLKYIILVCVENEIKYHTTSSHSQPPILKNISESVKLHIGKICW